jgi:catechol 2,3-dioxygenase-like lactoylglutathione lyase family enzyme
VRRRMARIDHVAFETADPDGLAAFYGRVFDAKVVKAEGHPVMAYLGTTGIALHDQDGPGPHTAVRVTEEEREQVKRRLEAEGVESEERDHGVGIGLFFRDPDGRTIEAITYYAGDDPRRRGSPVDSS